MLAIIPARGGSKGLPGKNIKYLGGKPLIAYTIEAALLSKFVDKVIVSTDDQQIADIAEKFGAEVPFLRPTELATDDAKAIDNYIYTVERLNKEYAFDIKEFVVLQPTSPLRTFEDIDEAISIFHQKNADSVISMNQALHPPLWAKKIQDNVITDYFNVTTDTTNRQDLDVAFMPNGAIYVFKFSLLKNKRTYISENSVPHIMPSERSIDIDSQMDFDFADFLLARKKYQETHSVDFNKSMVVVNRTIRDAMKILDNTGKGFLIVIHENQEVYGIITDGDIRRGVLKGVSLDEEIKTLTNNDFIYVNENYSNEDIIRLFNN
jgi:N-acylneuraminate cytidylyltransferase/CMP-N,N'-diacetyllegionaminic acid synthase